MDLLLYSEKNSDKRRFFFILLFNSSKTFIFDSLLILSSFIYLKKFGILFILFISSHNFPVECLIKIFSNGLSFFINNLI